MNNAALSLHLERTTGGSKTKMQCKTEHCIKCLTDVSSKALEAAIEACQKTTQAKIQSYYRGGRRVNGAQRCCQEDAQLHPQKQDKCEGGHLVCWQVLLLHEPLHSLSNGVKTLQGF